MSSVNKKQVLKNWEEIHKQGMLMFWVFTVLKKQPAAVDSIQEAIQKLSRHSLSVTEQSLYRSLRKHLQQGLVEYTLVDSPKGPDKKVWRLTPTGEQVYDDFVSNNIKPIIDLT